MTGDEVSGVDAVKIGLALDAVPSEQLDEEVRSFGDGLVRVRER